MSEKLRQGILSMAALGLVNEPEQFVSLMRAAEGEPIIQVSVPEKYALLGAETIHNTLDSKGDVLVAGTKYKFRDEEVVVLKEVFGSGNMFDTYYRICYLQPNLDLEWTVVERTGSITRAPIYKSRFEPLEG